MKKLITRVLGFYLNTLHGVSSKTAGAHGFRVFCYPFRTPLKPHQRTFLESARHERITVDGTEIQVYKWGSGERNLLLMHGWQSHSFRWKAFIDSFPGDKFSIYAMDAPGHGLSGGSFLTVPTYSTVVEQLIPRIGKIDTMIAHSIGAFTAVYTVSRLPRLPVNKLALLASPGEATEFINFFKTSLGLSTDTVHSVISHFESIIGQRLDYFSAPAFAMNIRQNGLLIHDEADDNTPHIHSLRIHEAWKNSELVITRGLGHNLKSPEVVDMIVRFVEKAPVIADF
jgi:pimeloyl-ACP methyl ester carboxylesterase